MSKSILSCISVLSIATITVGLLASPAWAIKQFQDQFYALYLDQEKTDSDVAAYATVVREAKCNLCHLGNSKKNRNTYGIELAKLLDNKADKGNAEKIRRAIEQVAALKSDPNRTGAKTFGQLISAGQLPGAEPETAVSPMDTAARSDEPMRSDFSLDAAK